MSILRVSPVNTSRPNAAVPELPVSPVEIAVVGFIIIVALYLGQAVFVPLALAVILSFVLAPPVRVLRRLGLPNSPSVILVVMLTFALIFGVGAVITQQVTGLAQELPRYQLTLKDKIKALKLAAADSGGAIERASATLKDLQKELEKPDEAASAAPPVNVAPPGGRGLNSSSGPIPVEVHEPNPTPLDQLQGIIGVVVAPLATAGLTILFVLFLLLQREDVRDRAIRLLGSHDLEKSTAAMDDAGDRLSRYFLALTGINAAYGIVIGTALWFLGVPSPALWGVLAMVMRFVPFIGSFIAAAFPLLLAAAVEFGLDHVPGDARPLRSGRDYHGQRHRARDPGPANRLVAPGDHTLRRVLDTAVGPDRAVARHSPHRRARGARPPRGAARVPARAARRHAAAVAARALLPAHACG